jgi:FixJ family two-component response regulator
MIPSVLGAERVAARFATAFQKPTNADQSGETGTLRNMVTDVVMPGIDGPELAKLLAAKRPDMRVLYVSGYADHAIVQHGHLEPGLAFLQKPFTANGLAQKVREVLDRGGS